MVSARRAALFLASAATVCVVVSAVQSLSSCPCAPLEECPPALRLAEMGFEMPRGHTRRIRIKEALKEIK